MPDPPQPSSFACVSYCLRSATSFSFFCFGRCWLGSLSNRPLADADIGWHIRTGEQILATHSLPRTDPYSSTMQGQPWFAWEWLYDILLGILHRAGGLNGVVWLCARWWQGFSLMLLSQLLQARHRPAAGRRADAAGGGRCDDSSLRPPAHCQLAVFSALVCGAGAMGSLGLQSEQRACRDGFLVLSRPRCCCGSTCMADGSLAWRCWGSTLFAAFVESVRRPGCLCQNSRRSSGSGHGRGLDGFGGGDARESVWLALAPHIYRYLSDRYLMNRIDEFQSPDFHGWAQRCFAAILLLTLVAFVGPTQQVAAEPPAGRAAVGLCGILFVAQSSGFFDAAGADRGADAVAELHLVVGAANRLAMAA
jgi:hypothetical protein